MKNSIKISLGLAVIAVLWIGSNYILNDTIEIDEQKKPVALDDGTHLPTVRTKNLQAELYTQEYIVRGQTRVNDDIDLKAEVSGPVTAVLAEKGKPVQKGDIIARIDPGERPALLKSAKALAAQYELELKGAEELTRKGFNAATSLAATRANYEAAQAAIAELEIELEKLTLRAPTDGILEDRYIAVGDYLEVGNRYARLVVLDPIKIRAQISETQIGQISQGSKAKARLATGQIVDGTVTYIAATADPATRTYTVEIQAANPDHTIPGNMTAELILPLKEVMAYKVSPAALSLADSGEVGIKTVNTQDRVIFYPVTILADEADGLWISGAPQEIRLITVGQEFVVEDQLVKPVESIKLSAESDGEDAP